MKKLRMLTLTLIMLILTILSYAYENFNIGAPKYKQPSININSRKFGEIKEVTWLRKHPGNILLILSSKEETGTPMSYLHCLNIDTGESKLLYGSPSHKTLNNVIFHDDPFSSDDIITTFDKGIIRTNVTLNENKELDCSYDLTTIEDFENANSMDFKGSLFFTKPDDNFIYVKQFYRGGLSFFNNQSTPPDFTKYYKKPYCIVCDNRLDRYLTYTSLKKDGIHLYSMNYDGTPVSRLNKPIIKNIVTAKDIGHFSDGYVGTNLSSSSQNNKLNIFMIRRNIENKGSSLKLDEIPFNLDRFGAVPSIDSITFNEDYSLIYASYNEKHEGQIKIANYNGSPKVIVEDKNLFGPVKISQRYEENNNRKLILYFTYEGDKIHTKICDTKGNLFKDISEMLL
ncbi:hypothetical protein JOC70_000123 [Clostridium pascui]|uniref:hypothetical protein n=1 Tax=Clostridium pascui TaxID=46609 RepID=UPI00195768B2|nr:hypothetical protein [Clostridium pascui]MBM7868654.1 hypothetical protein [Clostridium pascui]